MSIVGMSRRTLQDVQDMVTAGVDDNQIAFQMWRLHRIDSEMTDRYIELARARMQERALTHRESQDLARTATLGFNRFNRFWCWMVGTGRRTMAWRLPTPGQWVRLRAMMRLRRR